MMDYPVPDTKCEKCGAALYTLRFPFGFAVSCEKVECRGNGDDLTYRMTPESAIKLYTEGRKKNA